MTEGPAEETDASANEEWTTEQVLAHLADHGRVITPATWYSYVSRSQAPAPSRHVGRTPVWRPADIRRYLQESPGTVGRPRTRKRRAS